jgi:hypothetical protein
MREDMPMLTIPVLASLMPLPEPPPTTVIDPPYLDL